MSLLFADSGTENGGVVAVSAGANFTATLVDIDRGRSFGNGGAISNAGTTTLTDVIVSSNDGVNGGGIYNTGNLVINKAHFFSNDASNDGGAIYSTGSGTVEITNATFTTNTGSAGAGALSLNAGSVTNSTIASGNRGPLTGGIYANSANPIILQNVISADNTILNTLDRSSEDLIGPVISNGGNIIERTTETGFTTADQLGVDPDLGSSGDHGGFSNTVDLEATSIAIDFGTAANAPLTDQRGLGRSGNVDSGAFEFDGVTVVNFTLVVTTLNDTVDGTVTDVQSLIANKGTDGEISLREAIICLLYTSPSPRDATLSRMPSSA